MKIGLVSCGKEKARVPCEARNFYCSEMFTRSVALVERTCDEWHILSAKYGVVNPNEIISPYELVVKKGRNVNRNGHEEIELTAEDRALWYKEVNLHLRTQFPGAEFYALVTSAHIPALDGLRYEWPLAGVTIFERIKTVNELLLRAQTKNML